MNTSRTRSKSVGAPLQKFPCTIEGCTHRPFLTAGGLKGHLRTKHEWEEQIIKTPNRNENEPIDGTKSETVSRKRSSVIPAKFSDFEMNQTTKKRKIVENDAISEEKTEETCWYFKPSSLVERKPEPPHTIFSVGEMAQKLVAKLESRAYLSKMKHKEAFCVACLEYRLPNGSCRTKHNGNEERIQKLWRQLFPHRNQVLTREMVLDDLTEIATKYV